MSTPSTEDLARYALSVTGHPLAWHIGGPKGFWLPDTGSISIRHGMSEAQTRSTLAHELAHAESDHPCGNDPSIENAAHKRAAQMLITRDQYAQVERIYGADICRIAEELNVTVHLTKIWRDTSERATVQ